MTTTKPDWNAADKAYQAHHSGCSTCLAAGTNPTRHERCAEGVALWTTYQQAGDPPHFTWLEQEREKHARRTGLDRTQQNQRPGQRPYQGYR